MTETVDLPVAGPVKKQWVIVGGAAVAGIVGYAWWKYYRDGGAGEGPVELDPGFADYDGGLYTGTPGTTTPGLAYNPPGDTTDPDDLPPTTNAVWTVRGVDYLQNLGFDPQLVAVTLGKYLARVPVTAAEADIIRTAEGAIGKPPVGEYRIIMVGNPPAGGNPDPPPDNTQPPPVPEKASVPAGADIYQWCAQTAAFYHISYDLARMRALNPGIDSIIKWRDGPPGANYKIPYFPSGMTVKIR